METTQLNEFDEWLEPKETKPCPECRGQIKVSDCCGVEAVGTSEDAGLCPECKDHCEYKTDCTYCSGEGWILDEVKT